LLVIKAATTITAQDISMESAITSAIEHFLRHKNKRISRQALELAKAVEPIKDIVAEHWEGN